MCIVLQKILIRIYTHAHTHNTHTHTHTHLAAFSGFIAVGLFMDFYLWDFDSDVAFIDSTAPSNCVIMFNTNFSSCSGFAYLLRQGYTTHPTLQSSFALHCTGWLLLCVYQDNTDSIGSCFHVYTFCAVLSSNSAQCATNCLVCTPHACTTRTHTHTHHTRTHNTHTHTHRVCCPLVRHSPLLEVNSAASSQEGKC